MGVVVLRGNCPIDRGSCLEGKISKGVVVLVGNCQRGSCPTRVIVLQGSCPWGNYVGVVILGVVVPGIVLLETSLKVRTQKSTTTPPP